MKNSSRILWLVASLLLVLMFLLPIWQITLEAPQYPEGIGMLIHIDNVTGVKPNDLQNINGLNHYIGMKEIVPETIPELEYMPWIIGFLIITGLLGALSGKKYFLYSWVGLFFVIAIVGLVDFFLWEYDYGHDLNPQAAIKIPGMSFQPPLIGSKKLLNFTAHSWPALGGIAAFLSMALGLFAGMKEWRLARKDKAKLPMSFPAMLALLLLVSCTEYPVPIVYGEEACEHCRMGMADERFGAELVSSKGKVHKFDAIECMAAYILENDLTSADQESKWITDFQQPGVLKAIEEILILHSKDVKSPMGMNLSGFGTSMSEDTLLNAFYGEVLDWDEVLDLVNESKKGASL